MKDYKPYSEEAEQCVLGALLINPSRFIDVAEIISEDDFFMFKNKVIFRAMSVIDAKRQEIDVSLVIQHLSANSLLEEAGGMSYLAQLAHEVAGHKNVIAYARNMKEKSNERKIIYLCNAMISEITEGEDESEVRINNALSMPIAIENKDQKEPEFKEILKEEIKSLEERYHRKGKLTGLLTKYTELDNRFKGLQAGQLVILAGRPASGKTTMALNLALNMIFNGDHGSTLFFSLEMTAQELSGKMICALGKINYGNYKTGLIKDDEWSLVTTATQKLIGADLVIDDRAGITLQQIRAKALKQKRKTGKLKAIFVDYLTLIRTPGRNNRTEEVGALSRGLKSLSKELQCPVISLAQLSRKVEEAKDNRPMMNHLRDSGEIEQDADIIMMIYRDEVYNPDSQHKGIAEIITVKNRAGEIGRDYLHADLVHSKFSNLDFIPKEPEPTKPETFRVKR